MLSLHLEEIARLVGGTIDGDVSGKAAKGVSADTRSLVPGQLFIALRGGHEFVEEAFRKGACAAVVERDVLARGPLIRVQSTIGALGILAGAYRLMLDARVIAVTGSNGKTTTKDMIAHILSKDRRVERSRSSFNNDIGLPLTLLSAPQDAEFLILELGTNHPGDIARLAQWARPDGAVITSIGEAHLEGLGSVAGVALEKCSLLKYLRSGAFAVVPAGEPAILPHLGIIPAQKLLTVGTAERADFRATDVERTEEGVAFRCCGVGFRLGLSGPWNADNALSATAVAMMYGCSLAECAERLADFRPPKMRMERLEIGGIGIINDAYNANPVSTRGAIAEFERMSCRGRKIAVIGEMRELGDHSERLHAEIGELLARTKTIDAVVTIGPGARAMGAARHFDSVEEARGALCALVAAGDLVLVKGSRAVGLERVVKFLAEKVADAPTAA